MKPKVSVIIPNFNHACYLKQRIDSVLNQSFKDFEVIILDDCSTDDSKQVIEAYRNHEKVKHIILNDANSGSTFKQWKKGMSIAQGEYIWIAESDDYCDLNFLKVAIKSLEKNCADLFFAKSIRVNEKGEYIDELEWWYRDLGIERWNKNYCNTANQELADFLALKNTIVNASAVVFKNNCFLENNLEAIANYRFCGDWLFWMLFLQKNKSLCYSVETENYFRIHQNTTRYKLNTERNTEILNIYKWISKNIPGHDNNYSSFSYFFDQHIVKYPRRHLLKNLFLTIKVAQISLSFTLLMVLYYIKRINT
nr:glycosyltransferase family 2 protein [uncultured Pedobacter sp.]